jgi:replication initiation and membrane attachment protein
MPNSVHKLTPDAKFVMINANVNSMIDDNVLNNLYLPIIGRDALSLYRLLWSLSVNDHNQMVLHKHYELQSMLNLGIEKIANQRKALEAVNLLGTFVTEKPTEPLIYALQQPLSAKEFLKTDILSVMLLGKVGDETYKQIVSRLMVPLPDLGPVNNISASLLDVFQVPTNLVKHIPGTVNEVKQALNNEEASFSNAESLQPAAMKFDFNLILQMLTNSYVDQASVKVAHDLILSEHLLYGIDEVEMVKLIQKATDLNTNRLNQRRLKLLIAQQFEMQKPPVEHNQQVAGQSSGLEAGLDRATQQLIKISQATAPAAFLQQLKDQKHGLVTPGEQRILRNLVNLRVFPNEVINILIYHILVDEQHSTLNQNLISTIADDWSQKKVQTAQGAIAALRNHVQQKTDKTTHRRANKRINVKETLPDWAKEPQGTQKKVSKSGLTAEQKKKLAEQLNQLKNQK